MEAIDLAGLLDGIGVVGLCVFVVFAFFRGWICTGRELRAVEKQRDDWQRIALNALGVAERTTTAAEVTHDVLSHFPDPGGDR